MTLNVDVSVLIIDMVIDLIVIIELLILIDVIDVVTNVVINEIGDVLIVDFLMMILPRLIAHILTHCIPRLTDLEIETHGRRIIFIVPTDAPPRGPATSTLMLMMFTNFIILISIVEIVSLAVMPNRR